MASTGEAKLKPEFVVTAAQRESNNQPEDDRQPNKEETINDDRPAEKKPRISDHPGESKRKQNKKGQNKHRPGPHKFRNEIKLCPVHWDGSVEKKCENSRCPFMHDIAKYLEGKSNSIDGKCPNFETYGKCTHGLGCIFYKDHIDKDNCNIVKEDLWDREKLLYNSTHGAIIDRELRDKLRKRDYDFKVVDKICSSLHATTNTSGNSSIKEAAVATAGPFTNEDSIALRETEVKKLDWKDKLYLSPLTTVGNLPFRRICVDYGADITCSEMSLATSLVQGNQHEFALVRRHPCEKFWGVQLCASSGVLAAKAAKVLADVGIEYDFIDLNMGCPLEPIFMQGAGSGLMTRKNKFQTMVKTMSTYMTSLGKDFTVKMRTGIKIDKFFAHDLIEFCRNNGVAMTTLHGRTKDQRYTKFANWEYIGDCKKLAEPMPLFGNGDVLSYEDYLEKKNSSGVSGVMIGRGALIKPWIFQEIKEGRHIDMSSTDRLELIKKYCYYGLDHWGSDCQGVEATRRFLLEWLSFTHRYIPHGILAEPPQKINQRPPKYVGRDDMETLLGSANVQDWIKISEMYLGPVPDEFQFLPKHKANSWG